MTIKMTRRTVLASGASLALPACRDSKKGLDAEVLIIGAGLSGLHATRLLAAEGKDVLVLEGSDRIGGRLHTLDHGALGYTEGGGEQVGASYARIIDTAAQLGVELIPDKPVQRNVDYYYKDALHSLTEWQALEPHPFPAPFKGAPPTSPLFALAAKNNPLSAPQDWQDPAFKSYDISALDFLQKNGFDAEACRVIEIALNGNSLPSYSMMNLYRTLQLYEQSRDMGSSLSVQGGAQRLPEAMAKSLKRKVKTGRTIASIETADDAVTIKTTAGKKYRAPNCICTIPFGALRHIALTGPMSRMQNYAIKFMPYTQIFQIHFHANNPYWEIDQRPANMWADSPVERIFAEHDEDGKPTGLARAWINGRKAGFWTGRDDLDARFKSELAKVRPASEAQIEVLSVQDWTRSNTLSGGAYMHWSPGQIPLMTSEMRQPAGCLSFAGEHLSILHTGMEGAMESAEVAAFSLMDA